MVAKKTKQNGSKRRPWTKEHVVELKKYSKAKTPVAKIAKAMKRTPGALRQKALQLEPSMKALSQLHWDDVVATSRSFAGYSRRS